jgi:hypothetical protein
MITYVISHTKELTAKHIITLNFQLSILNYSSTFQKLLGNQMFST